jgi:hypothetical protein
MRETMARSPSAPSTEVRFLHDHQARIGERECEEHHSHSISLSRDGDQSDESEECWCNPYAIVE